MMQWRKSWPVFLMAAMLAQGCGRKPDEPPQASNDPAATITWESLDRQSPLPQTMRRTLKSISAPVVAHLFYPTGGVSENQDLLERSKAVHLFLWQLAAASDGKITLRVHDVPADPASLKLAVDAGLSAMGDQEENRPQIFYGLVLTSGERTEKVASVPFLRDATRMEIDILRSLLKVSMQDALDIVVLSPSSLPQTQTPAGTRPSTSEYVLKAALSQSARVRFSGSLKPADLQNCDCLIVFLATRLDEDTLNAVDEHVMGGGGTIVIADPFSVVAMELPAGNAAMNAHDLSRIPSELLSAWGVTVRPHALVSDPRAATRIRLAGGRIESLPLFLSMGSENLGGDWPYDTSVSLLFPFAGFIEIKEDSSRSSFILLKASEQAGITEIPQDVASIMGPMAAPSHSVQNPSLCLAAKVVGRLPSLRDKQRLADKEATVLFVADSDFLAERFAVSKISLLGRETLSATNDNINFMSRLVDMCTTDKPLFPHAPSPVFDDFRRYDRDVRLVSEKLAGRWRARERELQEKLETVQMRLKELQEAKSSSAQLILSNEQKRMIEEFKEEMKSARAELRRMQEEEGRQVSEVRLPIITLPKDPRVIAAENNL